jgi:hypothetical protein
MATWNKTMFAAGAVNKESTGDWLSDTACTTTTRSTGVGFDAACLPLDAKTEIWPPLVEEDGKGNKPGKNARRMDDLDSCWEVAAVADQAERAFELHGGDFPTCPKTLEDDCCGQSPPAGKGGGKGRGGRGRGGSRHR